jgi:hypothetical protein
VLLPKCVELRVHRRGYRALQFVYELQRSQRTAYRPSQTPNRRCTTNVCMTDGKKPRIREAWSYQNLPKLCMREVQATHKGLSFL